MKNKISLEVIATFENHNQDIFKINLSENENKKLLIVDEVLKSENNLLNYLKDIILYPKDSDLIKLSLCWICSESMIEKYNTIKESILNNGKYFFKDGVLI